MIKEKGISLIVLTIIIVISAMLVATAVLFINNNSEKTISTSDSNNTNRTQTSNSDNIIQIEITPNYTIALTKSGDLYGVGKSTWYWGNGETKLSKPTLLAKNVKSFSNGGKYYISNTNELYICGVRHTGGVYDQYEKIGDNIQKVAGNDLGCMALSIDGYIYAYGPADYTGVGKGFDTLTKIDNLSNVSDICVDLMYAYYINNNNELYAKDTRSSGDFEKILDNVEKAELCAITTKDGKIYEIDYDSNLNKITSTLQENANGVITVTYNQFATNPPYYTKDNVILDSNQSFVTERYFFPKDAKKLIFLNNYSDRNDENEVIKYIYVSNNNRIKLYSALYKSGYAEPSEFEETSKELDYSIDSLPEIYEFAQKFEFK